MRKYTYGYTCFLLASLALILQSCSGISLGSNSPFQTTTTKNGHQIGINATDQAVFKGKIYFTIDRNLYVLDGTRTLHQLTSGMDVRDPAVSPDGKWIAFIIRYKNYSNLAIMPASGGKQTILADGNGKYVDNPGYPPKSTHRWFAQPAWASDSQHLLFLSDLEKFYPNIGVNAFLLDLMVFSISINTPVSVNNPATYQEVAYSTYGDGGLRDPSYRPGHADQIIYTNYRYDTNNTNQLIQLYLEDPNTIAQHPYKYHPGATGIEFDPAVAVTPQDPNHGSMNPSFSPDGNRIAYVHRDDATHMSLNIMPVPENVTSDPNNPAFDSNSTANQSKALLPYNQSIKLLTQEFLSQPVWSPDGTQLAYVGYANNSFDISLATLQKDAKTGKYSIKGTPVQLTDTGGHLDGDSRPFWTA